MAVHAWTMRMPMLETFKPAGSGRRFQKRKEDIQTWLAGQFWQYPDGQNSHGSPFRKSHYAALDEDELKKRISSMRRITETDSRIRHAGISGASDEQRACADSENASVKIRLIGCVMPINQVSLLRRLYAFLCEEATKVLQYHSLPGPDPAKRDEIPEGVAHVPGTPDRQFEMKVRSWNSVVRHIKPRTPEPFEEMNVSDHLTGSFISVAYPIGRR